MIPRILHHIWVGPPMPAHLARYVRDAGRMHPDWEHRLWGDADLGWLALRDLYDRAEELSPRNVGQFRSNIARLEILLRHGGVYADCDMEMVRPLDPLLDDPNGAFSAWHTGPAGRLYLTNALIGAEPGHAAMASLVGGIPASIERNRGLRSIHTTGVRYMTERLAADGLMDRLTVHPEEMFYPYHVLTATENAEAPASRWPDAWAVHRWNNRVSGGWTGDAA